MATTAMTIRSNRERNRTTFFGTVTGVTATAVLNEMFTLPAGFGDLWLDMVGCDLFNFGATPTVGSLDGPLVSIYGSDGVLKDVIGTIRWVTYTSNSARPNYAAVFDLNNPVLVRQDDRIHLDNPVMSASSTVDVDCFCRGIRLRSG